MKINVFGHDSAGKPLVITVEAESSAEALEKARTLRPDCRFNHCNVV